MRIAAHALSSLLVLTALTVSLACPRQIRAQDRDPARTESQVSAPVAPRHHHALARKPGQVIEDEVRKLTRALDLTPDQQAKLREILVDQGHEILQLRGESVEPGTDRIAMNMALLDRTKARIRAMLSDEQKQKYIVDVPAGQTAPAQADLQHWLDVQDSGRRASVGDSK